MEGCSAGGRGIDGARDRYISVHGGACATTPDLMCPSFEALRMCRPQSYAFTQQKQRTVLSACLLVCLSACCLQSSPAAGTGRCAVLCFHPSARHHRQKAFSHGRRQRGHHARWTRRPRWPRPAASSGTSGMTLPFYSLLRARLALKR